MCDWKIEILQAKIDDIFSQPQNQPDRNRIVSVYRSRVDKCDRLWFVDTGNLEYPGASIQVQPPSIWIFDLNTDSLVRRAEMPTANVVDGHGIASLTIDIDDNNCGDAYAYLPDLVNYRLHVYRYFIYMLIKFNREKKNVVNCDRTHSNVILRNHIAIVVQCFKR